MIHCGAAGELDELGGDVVEAGLARSISQVRPWTSVAPASISRSGLTWKCTVAAGGPAVDELDGGDFDDAVALPRVEAGGFGVEMIWRMSSRSGQGDAWVQSTNRRTGDNAQQG